MVPPRTDIIDIFNIVGVLDHGLQLNNRGWCWGAGRTSFAINTFFVISSLACRIAVHNNNMRRVCGTLVLPQKIGCEWPSYFRVWF